MAEDEDRGPVRQAWEDDAHRETTTLKARQGVTFGHMRYVLLISTVLLVVIYAFLYLTGAPNW